MKTIILISLFATLAHAQRPPGEPEPPRREPGFELRKPREIPTPFIGLITRPAPAEIRAQLKLGTGFGLVIDEVLPESPASTAGLQENDILIRLNDQRLVSPEQLHFLILDSGKDKEITLTYIREGAQQTTTLKAIEKMMPERRPMPNLQGNPMRQPNPAGEQERITRKDAEGRYELQRGPSPTFHIMDLDGKTIWKGPINGPELRSAVPKKYQPILDAMDREGANRPRNPQPIRPIPQ